MIVVEELAVWKWANENRMIRECWECAFYSRNRYGDNRLSPPECTHQEREGQLQGWEECKYWCSVADAKYWSRIEEV